MQIKPWRWEDIDGKSKLVIDPIILAYGDPNLPADVLEQYRQRVGKFPGLVDRSGKIVVPSERD